MWRVFAQVRAPSRSARLVERDGHALEPGEVDDHRLAAAPHRDEDERRLRPGGVAHPVRLAQADLVQPRVHEAVLAVEDPGEEGRLGHERNERGQEEQGPVDRHPAHLRVQEHREPDRDRRPQRHRAQHVDEGVPHSGEEHLVAGQLPVVGRPDPLWRTQHGEVREAVEERRDERVGQQDAEAQDPGRGEEEADPTVASHERDTCSRYVAQSPSMRACASCSASFGPLAPVFTSEKALVISFSICG